ncbi:PREDICTED: ATP synthase mitochondrial F1 complex assembly factor 2 isoform X2 [Galeopterus variegatus]|uniref:ATP synthase mitochondrial F1 complex assembly factor 2 isoform X2 n=1 Tax=Galeopterus variegatus TaxID=482537 RepID=A0ABM0Q7V8_GALVR|nr:PREDICTED: ATP synthase mitochondrial F1 complex assembly factor 2 isoform X2 [Galeopterus variegatus]
MWRSCLRLRDGGRRLLNRAPGGRTASVGPGLSPQSPARAYAPPTGEARTRFLLARSRAGKGRGFIRMSASHRVKTTLCNTSLDNPTQRNKDQLIRATVKFLDTDTICYRVEEPETLVELQKNEWDPIIEWAEKRYGVEIGSSTSIMGPSVPAKTREVLVSHLASYNMWALQGIEFVVAQLKSMVLTLGLIDLRLTVEQAVLLSRLEEEYQIQKWGNIEWAHDYELQELRARTAAGTLFVHLCSESTTVKHKLLQE